jgi:hypothetical protein
MKLGTTLTRTFGGAVIALGMGGEIASAETVDPQKLTSQFYTVITPGAPVYQWQKPLNNKVGPEIGKLKKDSCVEVYTATQQKQTDYVLVSVKENPRSSATQSFYIKPSDIQPAPDIESINCGAIFGDGALPEPLEEKPAVVIQPTAAPQGTLYTVAPGARMSKEPTSPLWNFSVVAGCATSIKPVGGNDTHIYVRLEATDSKGRGTQTYFGYIDKKHLTEKGSPVPGRSCTAETKPTPAP